MKFPKKLEQIVAGIALSTTLALGGCGKSSPTSPDDGGNISPVYHEVQSGITNDSGITTFYEANGNEVNIYVKDRQNRNLKGMNVVYHDGNGFETFIVKDPFPTNYFPRLMIYNQNSDHIINLNPVSLGEFVIDHTIGGDVNAVKNFLNYLSSNQSVCTGKDFGYVTTFNNQQMDDVFQTGVGITLFAGGKTGSEVIKTISTIDNLVGLRDKIGFPVDENYDIFDIDRFNILTGGMDVKVILPSNKPSINIQSITTTDNSATVNYLGSDKNTYFNWGLSDPTVACLGKSSGHDLNIFYTLDNLSKRLLRENWKGGLDDFLISNLSPGKHTISLEIADEALLIENGQRVGNRTTTPVDTFTVGQPVFNNLEIIKSYQQSLLPNSRLFRHNNGLWIQDGSSAYKLNLADMSLDLSSKKNIPSNTYDIVDVGSKTFSTRTDSDRIFELDDNTLIQTPNNWIKSGWSNIDLTWSNFQLRRMSTVSQFWSVMKRLDINNMSEYGNETFIPRNEFNKVFVTSIDNKVVWGADDSDLLVLYEYSSPNSQVGIINSADIQVFKPESISTSVEYFNNNIYSTTVENGILHINKHNWE